MSKTKIKEACFYVSSAFIAIMAIVTVHFGWLDSVIAKEKPNIGANMPPVQLDNVAKAVNNAYIAASEAVIPTVVSIQVVSEAKQLQSFGGDLEDFFFGWPFGDGNKNNKNEDREVETPKRMGSGSGVIITPDGYIVTNNHVVEGAIENGITVITSDKKEYEAKLIGTDSLTDLAIIKIDGKNLPAAHLGDMSKVKPGEMVIAVGSPLRLQHTVTQGIVSALGRGTSDIGAFNSSAYSIANYIQTDAAINPGNSGGGLFNLNGSLIGINTAIASQTGSFIGYGFAVPVDIVKATAQDLIANGKVEYGYIGAQIRDINSTEAKYFGLDKVEGVLVNSVQEKSAAESAGIQSEDIILAVNGKTTGTVAELKGLLATYRAGDEVTLTIWRDKKSITKKVKLKPANESDDLSDNKVKSGDIDEDADGIVKFDDIGFTIESLSKSEKEKLDIDNGVLIKSVKNYSIASKAGMRAGSVILKADRKKIETTGQLKKIINSKNKGESVLLNLRYGKSDFIIVIEIP
ncbi:MAG: trypsin-like peptidase domain-containing protein [Bacteroidetes bacterium]|nr:trypsin-like peptidase domain-containing protein [Bacteroidota bacterium]